MKIREGSSRRVVSMVFCLVLFAVAPVYADVVLPTSSGPITLPESNFASAIVGGSYSSTSLVFGVGVVEVGPFTAAEVAPYILGYDISNGLALGQGPVGGVADYLVPGFGLASIINGAGADLVIWEAGSPAENFLLGISTDGGATFSSNISYNTFAAVPADSTSGYQTNTAFIDLADFGIGAGVYVDAIRLEGLFTGIGGSGPDILAIGIINAGPPTGNIDRVPEPGTMMLLGSGLVGLVGFARRRVKK